MKIYVLSDTHNSVLFAPFLELIGDADHIIHLGDGSRDVSDLISIASCPVTWVKGNCDISGPRELTADIGGKRFFITHGNEYGVKSSVFTLAQRALGLGADVALYGHTHIPRVEHLSGVTVLNPGSLTRPRDNYKQTYLIIKIEDDKLDYEFVEYKGDK